MAAEIHGGDRVLVTIVGTLSGQRTLNTFLYRVSNVTGTVEMSDAFTALHSSLAGQGQLRSAFRACVPTNYNLTAMWYQIIRPQRLRKLVYPVDAQGLFGSTAQTPNVQASITRVGEFANRKSVGGVRIPIGTDSTATVDGLLTSGQKTVLQGLANAMKLNVITSGAVVTYIPQVGLAKPPDLTIDLYDAFYQDTTRVIRRRTVGLGI